MKRADILAVYEAGPEAVVALVEQLLGLHAQQLADVVERHQAQVTELNARIERLEARLGQDSHNRHKPPSSDGPAKLPARRSRRQRRGKKSGGQVGHPGATLLQVEQPDRVVTHRALTCPQCQTALTNATVVGHERRQVVDLPTSRPQVTECQFSQSLALERPKTRCLCLKFGTGVPKVWHRPTSRPNSLALA